MLPPRPKNTSSEPKNTVNSNPVETEKTNNSSKTTVVAAERLQPGKPQGKKSEPKAPKGFFGNFVDRVTDYAVSKGKQVANAALESVLNQKIDKSLIKPAKRNIEEVSQDPQLIGFIDVINELIFAEIKKKCTEVIAKDDNQTDDENAEFFKTINNHDSAIKDILKVNLFTGFSHLVNAVREHKGQISNYDTQPFFVSIITYLCQNSGKHISQEMLLKTANSYQDKNSKLKLILQELFPDPKIRAEKEKAMNACILSSKKSMVVLRELLEDREISVELMKNLSTGIDAAIEHNNEIHLIFEAVADSILTAILPNKVQSIILPGSAAFLASVPFLPGSLYNAGKNWIAEQLLINYLPIEYDGNRVKSDLDTLSKRIGDNLNSIINTPSAFLMGWVLNAIQTDPNIVELIAEALVSKPSVPKNRKVEAPEGVPNALKKKEVKPKKEIEIKKELIDNLSRQRLASWLLGSLKPLLNTLDPTLLGLGEFAKKFINDLALTLLVKGTETVFSKDEKIKDNQFLKELVERITSKIQEKRNDANFKINKKFIRSFLDDLPLPDAIKDSLVPLLKKQLNDLQSQLSFEKFNEDDAKIEEKIGAFKNGEHILSLIETVSDELVDEILRRNNEFLGAKQVEDLLNEILDVYLPGIEIDKNLKEWLKTNIGSFSSGDDSSLQSIQLLKKGIQIILRKSISTTIEANFKNDKDYAAQLLKNIDHAFSIAFKNFDEKSKELIIRGQRIQVAINEKKEKIEELNKQTIDPTLTKDQIKALTDLNLAHSRYLRALKSNRDLHSKQSRILTTLDPMWMSSETRLLARNLIATYHVDLVKLTMPANAPEQHREILEQILAMNPQSLKSLTEAMNIDGIIENTPDVRELDRQLKSLEESIKNVPPENNRKKWEEAFGKQKSIEILTLEMIDLEKELDECLPVFKTLSAELAKLIGLDEKEKLHLPKLLQDKIWPSIQLAKEETISRLLFTHFTPLILVIDQISENRQKIDNEFVVQVTQAASKQIINQLGDFLTSYKPFAKQVLIIMGIKNPSPKEIRAMERALQKTMICLGKKKITENIFEPILKGYYEIDPKQDANNEKNKAAKISGEFAVELQKISTGPAFVEFTPIQIFDLSIKLLKPRTKQESKKIARKSAILTKQLNYILLSQGKPELTSAIIFEAYKSLNLLPVSNSEEKITALRHAHISEKIKHVVITPEEIAEYLNDFIPGANDLHSLIAPELQAVITGEDNTFVAHRDLLSKYVEGMLLRIFIKIAEANQVEGKEVLEVITEKLKNWKDLVPVNQITGNSKDMAEKIIEQLLIKGGGLQSPSDFRGVPLPLQKLVYDKFIEVCGQHLTPIVESMLEVDKAREQLKVISGSDRLGAIGSSLISFLFEMIPSAINHYGTASKKIYSLLDPLNKSPDQSKINALSLKIEELVNSGNLKYQLTKLINNPEQVEDLVSLINQSFLDEKLFDKIKKFVLNEKLDQSLAGKIFDLAKSMPEKKITEKLLVEAFLKVSGKTIDAKKFKEAENLLSKNSAIDEIKKILITPQEISQIIKNNLLPVADDNLQNLFVDAIRHFMHEKPALLNNTLESVSPFLNSILLKLLINVSKKNPPVDGKDSLIVAFENILKIAEETYQDARIKPFDVVAKEFENKILKDVLGIDSPESIQGIPPALQEQVYALIKNQLSNKLLRIQEGFQKLDSNDPQIVQAHEHLKTYGVNNQGKAYAETFVNDLGHFTVAAILDFLPELKDNKFTNLILKGVQGPLETLAQTNQNLSDLLLNFVKAPQVRSLVQGATAKIVDNNRVAEDKLKAATFVSNLVVVPLDQALERVVTFEKSLGENAAGFNKKLIVNLLGAAVEHIKIKNEAKAIAAENGRKYVSYDDYVKAAGDKLPAGMPLALEDYKKSLTAITNMLATESSIPNLDQRNAFNEKLKIALKEILKQEENTDSPLSLDKVIETVNTCHFKATGKVLTQGQRALLKAKNKKGLTLDSVVLRESKRIERQLEKHIYGPDAKIVLGAIFPNGQNDLFFLPPEDRANAWKIIESIAPSFVPQAIESLFNPDMVNKIMLSTLESARDSLDKKIDPSTEKNKPKNLPLDELDEISGELITQLMKNISLPSLIKHQIVGSKGATPAVKAALGSALREEFNGMFVQKLVPQILEALAKRDPKTGDFALNPKIESKAEKLAALPKKRKQMDADLRKVSRQVVNSAISHFIRKLWTGFQKKFDNLIKSIFGKIGSGLKWALDKVFHFIFMTIIGNILSVLLWPLKKLLKEMIYRTVSLDKNLNSFLDTFRDILDDQPLAHSYGINNIPLFHGILQGAYKAFTEAAKPA